MPAPASLSIPDLVDQVGGVGLPNPITVAPELRAALAQVSDPRKPRGVRHGLVVVLTTADGSAAAVPPSVVAAGGSVNAATQSLAAAGRMERALPGGSSCQLARSA